MPERSRTAAPAQASSQHAEPSRLEAMLQKLIERMEESDRRYSEALDELHGRLESLAHQAQSAREAGDWGHAAELERVESHAASLAERLREAKPSHRSAPESSTLRDIEQRITAFAEEMSAASGSFRFEQPFVDFGREPEEETPAAPPQPEWRPPYPRQEDFSIPSAPREPEPREPEMSASDFDLRFKDLSERLDKSLSEPSAAREFEIMRDEVEDLSHGFESALGQPGEAQSLRSIDRKLDELARHFDRAEQQHGRMASIESQLLQLIDMMQGSGSPIEEAANKAAQAAARLVADKAGAADALQRLDTIQAELRAINERTKTMDERTVDTLEAMNDTLKNLASRVGVIRNGPPPSSPPRQAEPFRAEAGPVPPEFLDIPAPHEALSAKATAEMGHPEPGREGPVHRAVEPAYREPGETRKDELREPTRRLETAPSDDDFIASARRAAQAAARQAQEQGSGGFGLLRRASGLTGSAAGSPGDESFEPNEGRRSRKLLVFAAIFLLIVSAALLYTRLKSKDDRPVATPMEQPAPSAPPAKPAAPSTGQQGRGEPAPHRNDSGSLVGSAPQTAAATTILTRAPAEPAPAQPAPQTAALSVPGVSVEVHSSADQAAGPSAAAALRSAAIAGNAAAQYALATRLAAGTEGKRDFTEAAKWYEKAASQGYAPAQFRLAALSESGQGVSQDRGRAKAWYLRAAEQGNVNAMHNLAVLYADGGSENADYRAAVRWFQAAAAHGLPDSQFNLGILYEAGLGVQMNLAEAYKWFSLAAARGDAEAKKRAEQVRLRLPADALLQADEAIAQWKAEPLREEANAVSAAARGGADELAASVAQESTVLQTQTLLRELGYEVGVPDGLLGPKTEAAIRLFEERVGLPVTGRPSDELLARLRSRSS